MLLCSPWQRVRLWFTALGVNLSFSSSFEIWFHVRVAVKKDVKHLFVVVSCVFVVKIFEASQSCEKEVIEAVLCREMISLFFKRKFYVAKKFKNRIFSEILWRKINEQKMNVKKKLRSVELQITGLFGKIPSEVKKYGRTKRDPEKISKFAIKYLQKQKLMSCERSEISLLEEPILKMEWKSVYICCNWYKIDKNARRTSLLF